MMELREQIARAICGNWVVGDDRPWQQWTEEADAVLEVFRQATLTDTFVQPVPDRCDRIIWRGAYYHLPIAQAPVPDGWQPIETAPKDTFLLLGGPSGYTTVPFVCTTGRMCSDYKAGRWIDHANDDLLDWGFKPTHWMPLPEQPK